MFDKGQTVRGIWLFVNISTNFSSLRHWTPWSILWTFKWFKASQIYSGGPSSPAWATVINSFSNAFLNNFSNLLGGLPISEESNPTPKILSLCLKALSKVLNNFTKLGSLITVEVTPPPSPLSEGSSALK